ncbi:hypothetical protein NicSoilB11_42130 (plasmid) [Arthrobacter sp. NicSoilB11]|nr:hypothetical protein NicSoilB11_42130 [Arthrobacter sp. NicSoilB11]
MIQAGGTKLTRKYSKAISRRPRKYRIQSPGKGDGRWPRIPGSGGSLQRGIAFADQARGDPLGRPRVRGVNVRNQVVFADPPDIPGRRYWAVRSPPARTSA